jgi:hypothetical protein
VELQAFIEMLRGLGPEDLTAVARAIDASHQTAADEVMAWEDLMRIDEALRLQGRSRVAARAAHEAVAAVRVAVASSHAEVPESVVTRVAREAALLARAMVAGAPEPVANLQREFGFAIA